MKLRFLSLSLKSVNKTSYRFSKIKLTKNKSHKKYTIQQKS